MSFLAKINKPKLYFNSFTHKTYKIFKSSNKQCKKLVHSIYIFRAKLTLADITKV